jgi:hypothetical protein
MDPETKSMGYNAYVHKTPLNRLMFQSESRTRFLDKVRLEKPMRCRQYTRPLGGLLVQLSQAP